MHKLPGLALILTSAISLQGCAMMLSVPQDNHLVSNYREQSNQPGTSNCDLVAQGIKPASDKAAYGLNPELIRVLNWNVYKGTEEGWAADFSRLSRDSDIIALQEAQLHQDFWKGLKLSGLHWDLTTAFTYRNAETGVLMGATVRSKVICTQRANEPMINVPKSSLVTLYPLKGMSSSLMVANIHMINFTFGTDEYRQQISQLRNVLEKHKGPLIVTGDFNTWSDARMSIVLGVVKDLGLVAVEFSDDYRMTVFGNTLDHMFYRGLVSIAANTIKVESSDHNAMQATFRLAEF